jgi:hypothetical protein
MKRLKQISLSLPHRELLLFILTLLFFSTLPAQVRIKERTEIAPQISKVVSISDCGNYNTICSITSGISSTTNYPLSTFANLIGTFNVTPRSGTTVWLRGDSVSTIYGMLCCIGADDWLMFTINDSLVFEVGFNPMFGDYYNITPYVTFGTNSYQAIAMDLNELQQWLTPLRIDIRVTPVIMNIFTNPSVISPGETSLIYINLYDQCYDTPLITNDILYMYTDLSNNLYGHFINSNGDTVDSPYSTYSRQLRYVADSTLPTASVSVPISVKADDPLVDSVVTTIVVDPPPTCTELTVSPETISPGDTANIIIMRMTENNEELPFPEDYCFYIEFNNTNDTVFGKFLNPITEEVTDTWYWGPLGVKFIASTDTVPPDGYEIKFSVCCWSPCIAPGLASMKELASLSANKTVQAYSDYACVNKGVTIENGCNDNPIINLNNSSRIDNNDQCNSDWTKSPGSGYYGNYNLNIGLCYNKMNNCTRVQLTNLSSTFIYGICYASPHLSGKYVTSWSSYLAPNKITCSSQYNEVVKRKRTLLNDNREDLGVEFKTVAFEDEILAHELSHQKRMKEYIEAAVQKVRKKPIKKCLSNEERNNFYQDWYGLYQQKFVEKIDEDVKNIEALMRQKYGVTFTSQIRRDELEAQAAQAEKLGSILEQWPSCNNL